MMEDKGLAVFSPSRISFHYSDFAVGGRLMGNRVSTPPPSTALGVKCSVHIWATL